jgi:hypothetical protein
MMAIYSALIQAENGVFLTLFSCEFSLQNGAPMTLLRDLKSGKSLSCL